jgi:hypothetical protein
MTVFSNLAIVGTLCIGIVFGYDHQSLPLREDFQAGDLFYGLQKLARESYSLIARDKVTPDSGFVFSEPAPTPEPVIQNSVLPRPNFAPEQNFYTTADVYNRAFGRSFKTPRDEEYKSFMLTADGIKDGLTKKIVDNQSIFSAPHLKFLCKRAIDFTVGHERKIRFLLDGLNLQDVTSKATRYGPSFTASELRYIYRNWDRFRDHVVFYENGRRSEQTPWEIDPEAWEAYETLRQQKKTGGAHPVTTPISAETSSDTRTKAKRKISDFEDTEKTAPENLSPQPVRRKFIRFPLEGDRD